MSKEDYEVFKHMKEANRRDKQDRRDENEYRFELAEAIAVGNGFTLRKHSAVHYSLEACRFRWNLYPGNQRISFDKNFAKPPFMNFDDEWDLVDVVNAAVLLMEIDR